MAPANVRAETLKSLRKLRLDYVDMYLIHFPVAYSVRIRVTIHVYMLRVNTVTIHVKICCKTNSQQSHNVLGKNELYPYFNFVWFEH